MAGKLESATIARFAAHQEGLLDVALVPIHQGVQGVGN